MTKPNLKLFRVAVVANVIADSAEEAEKSVLARFGFITALTVHELPDEVGLDENDADSLG